MKHVPAHLLLTAIFGGFSYFTLAAFLHHPSARPYLWLPPALFSIAAAVNLASGIFLIIVSIIMTYRFPWKQEHEKDPLPEKEPGQTP